MATQYSLQGTAVQGVSIDNDRRIFNFGNRVAHIEPLESPFYVYLARVATSPTDDPVFKFLERRHQWQRRSFNLKGAKGSTSYTSGTEINNVMKFDTTVDIYGRSGQTAGVPKFLLNGQTIALPDTNGVVRNFRITDDPDQTADTSTAAEMDLTPQFTATCAFADNVVGQVIGSAFAEAADTPSGWKDEMYNREGYTQIFRTAIPLFSGTAMATRYRGEPNEFMRVWREKLKEHKMDIEHAMLFGVGSADESATTGPVRTSWGIVPYTEANGNVYNFTYAGSDYDDFIDMAEDFWSIESGTSPNKLVLCSRKVMTWLNKLNDNSFMGNTVGTSQYRLDIQNIKGRFGHKVTMLDMLFGNMHFVYEPLLRGPWEDYAVAIDMANVKYRPLVANGKNRNTFITTNVQNPGVDGRQDEILTEAGLEISLPETHAVLKWS